MGWYGLAWGGGVLGHEGILAPEEPGEPPYNVLVCFDRPPPPVNYLCVDHESRIAEEIGGDRRTFRIRSRSPRAVTNSGARFGYCLATV